MWAIQLLFAVGLWWLLLRLRLLPTRAMQYWFFLTNFLCIFSAAALTFVVVPLQRIGLSPYYTQRIAIFPLLLAFRAVWLLNPQVRMYIKFDGNINGQPRSWYDLPTHSCAIVGNHTSFWDIHAFAIMHPLSRLGNLRTLLKASLLEVPLFGGAMVRIGNFPVYFKSDEDGNFQVDKERQAEVQKSINRHILEGGTIAVFPEGAINRNPKTLQTFRFGTFQTIFEHRMPTYYIVMVGNEQTWPRMTPFGGLPADICARVGEFPIDFDKEDPKSVAQRMQAHMQKVYDEAFEDLERLKAGKCVDGYKEL